MKDASEPAFDYDEGWRRWDDMKRYGPMSRHTRRLLWKMIAPLAFRSVLDVGCGQGSPLEEIARRRPGVELAGVDISKTAVELARRRLPAARFWALDLTTERLARDFDLILCTDVLEHVEDDQAMLGNMRRMCGGWCLVSTLQGRMRDYERQMGHVRNYGRDELSRKMREAGFVIRHQIEWGYPLYSPLYREALRWLPPSTTMGEFGLKRRWLCRAIYCAFLANSSRRGDYIFCLAETG